jgi:nitrogen fixation protein FixH
MAETGPKLTGRKVFLILACFFGTIASADAVLVTSAVRTWSGTEATSPYKAGQLYNGELALARAQEKRHWTLTPTIAREIDGALRISVDLRDGSGLPIAGRGIIGVLERPTDKRADREIKLVEAQAGSYVALTTGVAPGQWDLAVDVMEGTERVFRRRMRIVLD